MKKLILIALLVSAWVGFAQAQSVVNTASALKQVASAPSGACYRGQVRVYASTVYVCPQSGTAAWTAVGSGIGTGDSPTLTGAWTWQVSSATALTIGPNGLTNPTWQVVTNVASAATGLRVTGNAAGSGVTLSALSSGTNENIIFAPKGTGQVVVPAGSASLPGIISSAASTTGFFFNSNPEINAILSGTGAFRLVGAAAVFKSTTQLGFNSTSDPATSGSQDTAATRGAAGVWRFTNGGTGASRILLGTSSDTSAAQLDVRSQTVGVPAAQLQAASGESASATVLSVKDGAGAEKAKLLTDGTYTSSNNIDTSQNINVVNSFGSSSYQASMGAGANGLRMVNNWALNWVAVGAGATSVYASSVDLTLRRAAAANLAFGAVDAAAPVAQTLSVQNVATGTSNTAGAIWTFSGSRGTGTGAGGNIAFNTAPAGSTGSSQNALVATFTIQSNGIVKYKSVLFANLPTAEDAGMLYCSDCTIASPCASGGTGAFAKGINGAWVCN